MNIKRNSGFTLIELLVVIGVIAILAAIVLVAVNPGRQFAQARDTQRKSDLYSITNAIYQFSAEHDGNLPDTDNDDSVSNFPQTSTCIGTGGGCFNLGIASDASGVEVIIPTYTAELPMDPSDGTAADSGYTIYEDVNERIVASASGELVPSITVVR